MRPSEYENVRLQEWIVSADKVRMTSEEIKFVKGLDDNTSVIDKDGEDFMAGSLFKHGHPLRASCKIKFVANRSKTLPNFSGGSLPRKDRPQEYYAATMMTLIVPWRSGQDLIGQHENWETAFRTYNFSYEDLRAIQMFNVRHEYADARDDFSAKRSQAEEDVNNQGLRFTRGGELDDESDPDNVIWESTIKDASTVFPGAQKLGEAIMGKYQEMADMQAVLNVCGWTNNPPEADASGSKRSYVPEDTAGADTAINVSYRPAKVWSVLLEEEKARRLQNKTADAQDTSTTPNQKSDSTDTLEFDMNGFVKMVDKTYIEKDFPRLSRDHSSLQAEIVKRHSLNTEQDMAFRIIGNHAVSNDLTQLLMYLGGMGGTRNSRVIEAVMVLFRERGEGHRFITLTPTGSAAALLNGEFQHPKTPAFDRPQHLAYSSQRRETVYYQII